MSRVYGLGFKAMGLGVFCWGFEVLRMGLVSRPSFGAQGCLGSVVLIAICVVRFVCVGCGNVSA